MIVHRASTLPNIQYDGQRSFRPRFQSFTRDCRDCGEEV